MSKRSIRAVIFDCDGTLVDSEQSHLLAWQQTMEGLGHPVSFESFLGFVGKSDLFVAKCFSESFDCGSMEDLLLEKNHHFQILSKKGLSPIEGAVDFVHLLAQEKERFDLKLGVASAAVKVEILEHLKHLDIHDHFDVVLSGHDDLHHFSDPEGVNKPKPYIYLHAAELLGRQPAECVVLEDSVTGITSAKAAGCFTVAIPNKLTAKQDFSSADITIDSLEGVTVEQFFQRVFECREHLRKNRDTSRGF